ncbi:hypothetical protein A2U01_0007739 [Trifolium medium]|uniref:Uncharacterized protein n=1 Tax=Trifolium medium TaxID=97028 RepID=A0A392MIJ0_9FABA|nr:hypothetical protein [Trifolium medium]
MLEAVYLDSEGYIPALEPHKDEAGQNQHPPIKVMTWVSLEEYPDTY